MLEVASILSLRVTLTPTIIQAKASTVIQPKAELGATIRARLRHSFRITQQIVICTLSGIFGMLRTRQRLLTRNGHEPLITFLVAARFHRIRTPRGITYHSYLVQPKQYMKLHTMVVNSHDHVCRTTLSTGKS